MRKAWAKVVVALVGSTIALGLFWLWPEARGVRTGTQHDRAYKRITSNLDLPSPVLSGGAPVRMRLDLTNNTLVWLDDSGRPTHPPESDIRWTIPVVPIDTIGSLAERYAGVSATRRRALMAEPTRLLGVWDEALTRMTTLHVRGSIGDPEGDKFRAPKREGDPGEVVPP